MSAVFFSRYFLVSESQPVIFSWHARSVRAATPKWRAPEAPEASPSGICSLALGPTRRPGVRGVRAVAQRMKSRRRPPASTSCRRRASANQRRGLPAEHEPMRSGTRGFARFQGWWMWPFRQGCDRFLACQDACARVCKYRELRAQSTTLHPAVWV